MRMCHKNVEGLRAQITDVHLGQAHCLSSQTPTLEFFTRTRQKSEVCNSGSASELQNSNLNFLLYCKLKWHNKANRGELVFAKVFYAIQ
jgi:hypothetical protein